MSVRKTIFGLIAFAFTAHSQAQSAPIPHDFLARYAVSFRGMSAGTLVFTFTHDNTTGHYVYETRAEPSFLASFVVSANARERSEMEINESGVRPLHWSLDDGKSGNKDDGDMVFDWSRQVASGITKGQKFEV